MKQVAIPLPSDVTHPARPHHLVLGIHDYSEKMINSRHNKAFLLKMLW